MVPFDLHQGPIADRNMKSRARLVEDRADQALALSAKLSQELLRLLPPYVSRFNLATSNESKIRDELSRALTRRQSAIFRFDKDLTVARTQCMKKVQYAHDLIEKQVEEERRRVSDDIESTMRTIKHELDAKLAASTSSHIQRLEDIKSKFSIEIGKGLQRIRQMKVDLNRLETVRDRQSKQLTALHKTHQLLRSPVCDLEKQVREMEQRVQIYTERTRPALEQAKKRCKDLRQNIREKSFFLECLIQRFLIYKNQKNTNQDSVKQDILNRALSIAETDVP